MKKKALVVMAALALMCCSVTAFAAGTCQDWKGTWKVKYDNATYDDKGLGQIFTKLCIIVVPPSPDYEVGDLCNNGLIDPTYCQCFDNITNPTKKVFCVDNTTLADLNAPLESECRHEATCNGNPLLQECYDDDAPNCVCIANPLYRDGDGIVTGTADVVIDNVTDTETTIGANTFNCIATGKRGTQVVTIVQPDNATLTLLEAYYPKAFYTPDNGTYLYFEGDAEDIGSLPFAQIPEPTYTGTAFKGVYGYLAYDYFGLLSGTKVTAPECVDNDNDTYGADCAAGADCDDNDATKHAPEDCNPPVVTCKLGIFPASFSKFLALVLPLQIYFITADTATAFTVPTSIDWGTDAIDDIIKLELFDKIIFGIIFVQQGKLVAGDYNVTVTYGSPAKEACAKIEVTD